jgi:hypothetical protein
MIAPGESVIVRLLLAERFAPLVPFTVRPWTAKFSATVMAELAVEFDVLNSVIDELPPPSEDHVAVAFVPLVLVVQIAVVAESHVGVGAV